MANPLLTSDGGGIKIEGMSGILKNLKKAKLNMGKGLEKGLVRAGLHLQRKSQKIVPVEFGVLKNSAFTRKEGSGLRTEVMVGYTAEYAVYVHEDPQARHAPGKTHKFLEKPAKEERSNLRKIIQKSIDKEAKK